MHNALPAPAQDLRSLINRPAVSFLAGIAGFGPARCAADFVVIVPAHQSKPAALLKSAIDSIDSALVDAISGTGRLTRSKGHRIALVSLAAYCMRGKIPPRHCWPQVRGSETPGRGGTAAKLPVHDAPAREHTGTWPWHPGQGQLCQRATSPWNAREAIAVNHHGSHGPVSRSRTLRSRPPPPALPGRDRAPVTSGRRKESDGRSAATERHQSTRPSFR